LKSLLLIDPDTPELGLEDPPFENLRLCIENLSYYEPCITPPLCRNPLVRVFLKLSFLGAPL